ncbi:MAG: right-handed parallel beta-helix repeat-containing protein [Phycisphaerae bacterium]|nr:right-handed parallel beta-helix repeat-containing protein [Phycisphaerae bacterium]
MWRKVIAAVVVMSVWSLCVQAADFYIDPEQGSVEGDGSASHPWRSLQAVIDKGLIQTYTWAQLPYKAGCALVQRNADAPIQGGDTIWLRSGYYGQVLIDRHYNTDTITLAAAPKCRPRFAGLHIRSSSNWTIKGLTISAEFAEPYKRQTLVQLQTHGWHGPIHDVTVMNCAVSSVSDTSAWTAQEWNGMACNGFQVDGTRMTICANQVRNVNFGISVDASHSLIQNNLVENFSGDGLRGLGDYSTFEYNTVKNCYKVNDNHDDGFQSWSVGPDGVGSGEVKGIVLRGNTIINSEDPDQPLQGALQGIGCFDGTFVDWVVENNVVVVDHWHGITLLGARHCRIMNNTVMDSKPGTPGPPWIKIDKHKNGTLPEGCVVANNLGIVSSARGVAQENNMNIEDPLALFVAPDRFDFHLLSTASAIDAGTSKDAPELDRDRIKRPHGRGVDLGAYEWHAD